MMKFFFEKKKYFLLGVFFIACPVFSGQNEVGLHQKKILIINDVQRDFLIHLAEPEKKKFLFHVLQQIEIAKRFHYKIILVKFTAYVRDPGPLEPSILQNLQGYSDVLEVRKNAINDGSLAIKKALDEIHFDPLEIDICGLNTAFCLRETILGLVRICPTLQKLTLIEEASCDLHGLDYHRTALKSLVYIPKVYIKTQEPIAVSFDETLLPYLRDQSIDLSILTWLNLLFDSEDSVAVVAHEMITMQRCPAHVLQSLIQPLSILFEQGDEVVRARVLAMLSRQMDFLGQGRESIEHWDAGDVAFHRMLIHLAESSLEDSQKYVRAFSALILRKEVLSGRTLSSIAWAGLKKGLDDTELWVQCSSAVALWKGGQDIIRAVSVIRRLLSRSYSQSVNRYLQQYVDELPYVL